MIAWPAQEAAERRRDARLEQRGLVGVVRRDEAEQERQDPVAVDDHVQRQDHHDQDVAEGAEAGDRERLERPDELARVRVEVRRAARWRSPRDRPGRGRGPSRRCLPRLEDVGQVARGSAGSGSTKELIDVASVFAMTTASTTMTPSRSAVHEHDRGDARQLGTWRTITATSGLRMNAISHARKKMRMMSPK